MAIWEQTISNMWTNETITANYQLGVDFGTDVRIWGGFDLDYDGYSYRGDKNKEAIQVDKGSPAKAKYAIFYAVEKDPVIFCKNRKDLYREVKKLLKRKDVDIKSIRIFQLIGGAKKYGYHKPRTGVGSRAKKRTGR